MTRLLVSSNLLNENIIELDGECHHKLHVVLKIKKGEIVELIDGFGNVYYSEVKTSVKTKTTLTILSKKFIERTQTAITLAQAIAKGDRFDYVIQKVTELGVTKIIPIITKRTIVKIAKDKVSSRLERWREIARHAIEQSGQAWLPEIIAPQTFEQFISSFKHADLNLFFNEEERERGIKSVWPPKNPQSVLVLIGPEGGFDPVEAELAKKADFVSISLGKTILRTDTAPIVALSIIKFKTGDMG